MVGVCTYLQILTSYHREECSSKGGASDGSCASGFGVCCVCKSMSYYSDFILILSIHCISDLWMCGFTLRDLQISNIEIVHNL